MRSRTIALALTAAVAVCAVATVPATAAERPNIVMLMTDDTGVTTDAGPMREPRRT